MGHTRRIAKGGAATPDIFLDPFVDKKPPPGHESLTEEERKRVEAYVNISSNTENLAESVKRVLYYIYVKWKQSQGQMINQPDPLENVAISKEQHDELREFLSKQKDPLEYLRKNVYKHEGQDDVSLREVEKPRQNVSLETIYDIWMNKTHGIEIPENPVRTDEILQNIANQIKEYLFKKDNVNDIDKIGKKTIQEYLQSILDKNKYDLERIEEAAFKQMLKNPVENKSMPIILLLENKKQPYDPMGDLGRSLGWIERPYETINILYDMSNESNYFSAAFDLGINPVEATEKDNQIQYNSQLIRLNIQNLPTKKILGGVFIDYNGSYILYKEDSFIGETIDFIVTKAKTASQLIIRAYILLEADYYKKAWEHNDVESFTKNVGDYMRSSMDGLNLWNASKWITVATMDWISNIYLWSERFVILKESLKDSHEYVNLEEIEEKSRETDEQKAEFFDKTKERIAAIDTFPEKDDKTDAIFEIKYEIENRNKYARFMENIDKVLLMDPETMAFLYTQTPSLWKATGFMRYEDTVAVPVPVAEQNIKMIMLLQYVRILSDFQKKKTNKFSAVKGYQGIGLLKDSLQDPKIQNEILKILESKEAWDRFLEKLNSLYVGFENPIQTMDQLKAFFKDVRKPLEMKALPTATAPAPAPAPPDPVPAAVPLIPIGGFCSIKNPNNFCYINASMQMFFSSQDFRNILINLSNDEINASDVLFIEAKYTKEKVRNLLTLLKNIMTQMNDYRPGEEALNLVSVYQDIIDEIQLTGENTLQNPPFKQERSRDYVGQAQADEFVARIFSRIFTSNLPQIQTLNLLFSHLVKGRRENTLQITLNPEIKSIQDATTSETQELPYSKYILVNIPRKNTEGTKNSSRLEVNPKLLVNNQSYKVKGAIVHQGGGDGGHYVYYVYNSEGHPFLKISDDQHIHLSAPNSKEYKDTLDNINTNSTSVLYEKDTTDNIAELATKAWTAESKYLEENKKTYMDYETERQSIIAKDIEESPQKERSDRLLSIGSLQDNILVEAHQSGLKALAPASEGQAIPDENAWGGRRRSGRKHTTRKKNRT